jgi:FkbM family methyltransferase
VAIPFTDRARLLVSRGMYGATQNVYCGLNDFEDMSFLVHYLRQDDVFVDVGANVGAYTVLASAAGGARTYAFEPSAAALHTLRSNVALNHIDDRVSIQPYAIGRAPGSVSISTEGPSAMHHIEPGSRSALSVEMHPAKMSPVEMRTVDSYDLRPAIMKIDVEGYEAEVLAGAMETASRPELVAIITENNDSADNYGDGLLSVTSFMSQHGFTAVTYDPWQRRISPKHTRSDNTLYVRDIAKAAQRVIEAPPFRVFGRSI